MILGEATNEGLIVSEWLQSTTEVSEFIRWHLASGYEIALIYDDLPPSVFRGAALHSAVVTANRQEGSQHDLRSP